MIGGDGKDWFVFDARLNKKANVDRIVNFIVRDDTIWLDNKYMVKLGQGSPSKPTKLAKDALWAWTKAHDEEDRVIYDRKTGALYYDADGTGKSAQVKIAILNKSLKLTHADFFVV